MSDNAINVSFLQGQVSTPGNDTNLTNIRNAVKGGGSTAAYINGQNPFANFLGEIGSGSISIAQSTFGFYNNQGTWVDTNIPVTFAISGTDPSSQLSLVAHGRMLKSVWKQIVGDNQQLPPASQALVIKDLPNHHSTWTTSDLIEDDDSGSGKASGDGGNGTFNVNGTDYTIYGSIQGTFAYSQIDTWILPTTVGGLGAIASLPFAKVSFSEFIMPLLKGWWEGEKAVWNAMPGATNYSAATEVLEESVEATTTEEAVGEAATEVTVTAAGALCFGVVLALGAVTVAVQMIEHYSYNNIQVYNLSNKCDAVWQPPHIYDGAMNNAPIINNNGDDYECLIGGMRMVQPGPHVQPVPEYGSANFGFASDSPAAGLGEAFGLSFYTIDTSDPATTASDYDNANPVAYGAWAVNIPFSGNNSIACTLSDSTISSDDYWNDADFQQETSVVFQDSDLGLQVSISIDYLTGTHPTSTGAEGYYYNSVITIEDYTG